MAFLVSHKIKVNYKWTMTNQEILLALKSYPVQACYPSKTMDATPQALQLVYQ